MLDTPSRSNDSDDRKLWFDYIKTLNERQLQAAQRSGITSYVLLGTLLGLLYRFGPALPGFIAKPENVGNSIVIFTLLTVVLSSFFFTVLALQAYLGGEGEFRAVPKSSEGAISVVYGILILVGAVGISLEVWIGVLSADRFRRYVLFVHAAWLTVNVVYPIFRYRQHARKAKDIKNPLPRFDVLRMPPWTGLIACVLTVIWFVLGGISLIRYLRTLSNYGLQPFKAASVGIILISIVGYMILRSLGKSNQHRYFGLERDIVLNRMTPAEIRERYLRDLSGPDMAQWLDDAFVTVDSREEHLNRERDSAQEKLKDIAAINAEYRVERKERAEAVAQGLRKAIDDCMSQYDVLTFQTVFFAGSYKTQEENEALEQRFKLLKVKIGVFKEKVSEALKVCDQAMKLIE
jgi:hypothetical protein